MRVGRGTRPVTPAAHLLLLVALGGCGAIGRVELRSSRPETVIVVPSADSAPAGTAPGGSAPGPPARSSATVVAVDNLFQPDAISVAAGTEVVWRNDGAIEHNIRAVDTPEPFGVELADFGPGATYAHTFPTPGTYRYYCTIHGTKDRGMIGTVEVTT